MSNKLFVSGIPVRLQKEEIVEHFSKYGKVVQCKMKKNSKTGRSLGYVHISFEDPAVYYQLVNTAVEFHGRVCECKPLLKKQELQTHLTQQQRLRLLVLNLNPLASNEDLFRAFRSFAPVAFAYVVRESPSSAFNKGLGCVVFASEQDLTAFVEADVKVSVLGKRVKLAPMGSEKAPLSSSTFGQDESEPMLADSDRRGLKQSQITGEDRATEGTPRCLEASPRLATTRGLAYQRSRDDDHLCDAGQSRLGACSNGTCSPVHGPDFDSCTHKGIRVIRGSAGPQTLEQARPRRPGFSLYEKSITEDHREQVGLKDPQGDRSGLAKPLSRRTHIWIGELQQLPTATREDINDREEKARAKHPAQTPEGFTTAESNQTAAGCFRSSRLTGTSDSIAFADSCDQKLRTRRMEAVCKISSKIDDRRENYKLNLGASYGKAIHTAADPHWTRPARGLAPGFERPAGTSATKASRAPKKMSLSTRDERSDK